MGDTAKVVGQPEVDQCPGIFFAVETPEELVYLFGRGIERTFIANVLIYALGKEKRLGSYEKQYKDS